MIIYRGALLQILETKASGLISRVCAYLVGSTQNPKP